MNYHQYILLMITFCLISNSQAGEGHNSIDDRDLKRKEIQGDLWAKLESRQTKLKEMIDVRHEILQNHYLGNKILNDEEYALVKRQITAFETKFKHTNDILAQEPPIMDAELLTHEKLREQHERHTRV